LWREMPNWIREGYAEHATREGAPASAHEFAVAQLLQGGAFAQAKQQALTLTNSFPDSTLGQEALAAVYALDGETKLATFATTNAAALNPTGPELQLRAARALSNIGEHVRACAHYRAAWSSGSSDVDGLVRAIYCWAEDSEPETLRERLEELPTRGDVDDALLAPLKSAASNGVAVPPAPDLRTPG